MAVDVCCSEIPSSGISPRISFSYDLKQTDGDDHGDIRLDSTLLDSGSEFDFCVGSGNSVQEISSADELFSNGKILPFQIKKDEPCAQKLVRVQRSASLSSSSSSSSSPCNKKAPEKKRLKELLLMNPDSDLDERPSSSRSFWQFKRSISLNHDRSRSKGLIRSLHFLSRSNSTGSAPNPKPDLLPKETQHSQKHQNLPKQPSPLRRSSSLSTTGAHCSYHSISTQKPPPRKSFGAYNGNGGVRVSPVLNFPPPSFMSNGTVGFFGFGSFLCSGKMKRKTR